jgi:hypothetical protein
MNSTSLFFIFYHIFFSVKSFSGLQYPCRKIGELKMKRIIQFLVNILNFYDFSRFLTTITRKIELTTMTHIRAVNFKID